jgi:hypothetical protein
LKKAVQNGAKRESVRVVEIDNFPVQASTPFS